MSTLELKVYEIFKQKMGTAEAETLIEYFEEKAEAKYQDKKDTLATKADLSQTSTALAKDIAQLRTDLSKDIAQSKVDMIKWMVGFWLTQMAVLLGLYLKG